jgi:hypothetical protein
MELSGTTRQVPSFGIWLLYLLLIFRKNWLARLVTLCACKASLFGLLCVWRWVHVSRQHKSCVCCPAIHHECNVWRTGNCFTTNSAIHLKLSLGKLQAWKHHSCFRNHNHVCILQFLLRSMFQFLLTSNIHSFFRDQNHVTIYQFHFLLSSKLHSFFSFSFC